MNSNEEIINELNTLKKEYNPYADKDRAIEIQNKVKQILQDAPDGTEMYRVVKETSSGWTSHGSYSDTRAVMKKLKKENGVWEMYGRRRDTIDDAMSSILYNDGDLMTKADAQAELAKQKENDVSTHRDIVNVGIDNAGNPVGKSTNRVDYPNKKEESTDASHLKIENVTPIYTGGGIYIYTGELSDGNYFIASDQSFVGDYFDIRIVDENPADYEEDFCDVTWQEEHLVSDVVGGEAREFTIQLLEWVLENHPEGNYQLGDIEAMLDSIQNKVEESKKVCENISSVDWEEENFDLIWDEYAKRKSKELGVTRDEIPEWGEEGFDEELYNEVAWELYNSDAGLPDPDMYMESKEPRSMSREDIMSCYISDITEAAYTYTPQEAQEEINNIFDDLKNDKDLDDVDKRFILKMVRGTLLNRDIKFPEITENKKVEEKYEYWSDKTEYTYFIVKDGTPTMHEIYTIINRKDNTITEIKDGEVRDTTAHCKELYNKDKRQNFMNKNGNYIGTDFYNCLLTGRLKVPTGDEVLIYTNNEDEFTLMLNNLKSVHLKTEASLNKFQIMTTDKDGNEMLLKDVSYNNACYWLEKELAKTGNKVTDTETKGNKTIIKADNKIKFEYDEEKGTLKRLEEAEARRNNKQLDYKLDGFKGVTISVVDKKNGIDTEDYMKFGSMEFGIDEYEFKDSMVDGIKDVLTNLYEFSDVYYDDVFTEDEIDEMAEDITQDVLQLYDDLPEENIDRKNGYAILNNNKSITEADKEIWNKVEKIVDLVDTEIEPDSNDECDYDEHITFVFYRDLEDIDMYEVYTYLDGEIQEDLDTGDVHISDLDSTLVDIVKKLKEVN